MKIVMKKELTGNNPKDVKDQIPLHWEMWVTNTDRLKQM